MPLLSRWARRMAGKVPISWLWSACGRPSLGLLYHMVSARDLPHVRPLMAYKTPAQFEEDLKFLVEQMPLARRQVPPLDGVLVTVDDGYAECCTEIAPVMKRCGVRGLFFLTTGWIDNQKLFHRNLAALCLRKLAGLPDAQLAEWGTTRTALASWLGGVGRKDEPQLHAWANRLGLDEAAFLREQKPYLTSGQIREMAADGFQFGAHSRFHDHFGLLREAEAREDILASCEQVRAWTGQAEVVFAFPHQAAPERLGLLREIQKDHAWITCFFARPSNGRSSSELMARVGVDDPSIPLEKALRTACRHNRRYFKRW